MKIAFSTSGKELTDLIDSRFGRASAFIIYDTDSSDYELVNNSHNAERQQGAGIQSAQLLVKAGVNAVVSGHCGPKALQVLQAAGISIFQSDTSSVLDALAAYNNGTLDRVDQTS